MARARGTTAGAKSGGKLSTGHEGRYENHDQLAATTPR